MKLSQTSHFNLICKEIPTHASGSFSRFFPPFFFPKSKVQREKIFPSLESIPFLLASKKLCVQKAGLLSPQNKSPKSAIPSDFFFSSSISSL